MVVGLGRGLGGDEGRLAAGSIPCSSSFAARSYVPGRGTSTPNCFAYSAFNRCQPSNFIASAPTMRPMRLTREEPIEHVEADVPARGAHRDEAAIDVVPEREARAAAERLQLPAQVVAAPAVLEQPSARRPASRSISETCGVGAPTVESFTGPDGGRGSDRRRTAPTRAAAPDRSAPARPSPADDAARGRERASTCRRPFRTSAPAAGPGAYFSRLLIGFFPFFASCRCLAACSIRSRWRSSASTWRRPEAPERREPGVDLHERLGPDPVDAPLRVDARLDEAGLAQHAQVLGHRRSAASAAGARSRRRIAPTTPAGSGWPGGSARR